MCDPAARGCWQWVLKWRVCNAWAPLPCSTAQFVLFLVGSWDRCHPCPRCVSSWRLLDCVEG
jgi:hypothetical protein